MNCSKVDQLAGFRNGANNYDPNILMIALTKLPCGM